MPAYQLISDCLYFLELLDQLFLFILGVLYFVLLRFKISTTKKISIGLIFLLNLYLLNSNSVYIIDYSPNDDSVNNYIAGGVIGAIPIGP
jgi:hypothetical protein